MKSFIVIALIGLVGLSVAMPNKPQSQSSALLKRLLGKAILSAPLDLIEECRNRPRNTPNHHDDRVELREPFLDCFCLVPFDDIREWLDAHPECDTEDGGELDEFLRSPLMKRFIALLWSQNGGTSNPEIKVYYDLIVYISHHGFPEIWTTLEELHTEYGWDYPGTPTGLTRVKRQAECDLTELYELIPIDEILAKVLQLLLFNYSVQDVFRFLSTPPYGVAYKAMRASSDTDLVIDFLTEMGIDVASLLAIVEALFGWGF